MPPVNECSIAFDFNSVRTFDVDGRMHIASSVVSAAQVNDYRCEEIPDWQALGLTAGRVYALLRDPIELEKGAPSLHGNPLVIVHRGQTADDHDRQITVGSVSNPVWESPNIKAEITVWDGEAIALIQSGEQRDLSAGYHYRAVMEPGEFNGVKFDGRMTEIAFNHLALVSQGRVIGAIVGDSALPKEEPSTMTKTVLSLKAAVTKGALLAYFAPKLAQDAKLDLTPFLAGVTAKNFVERKPTILADIRKAAIGKLAKDAKLDDMEKAMDVAEKDDEPDEAEDDLEPNSSLPEAAAAKKKTLDAARDAMKDDDKEAYDAMCARAMDESEEDDEKKKPDAKDKGGKDKAARDKAKDEEEDKDMVTKGAMDAALKATAIETAQEVRKTERGIRTALADVRTYVGDLPVNLAFDSGVDVYRHAAVTLGIANAKTMHADALWPVIQAQPKPGAHRAETANDRLGMDAAAIDEASKIAPGLARIRIGA